MTIEDKQKADEIIRLFLSLPKEDRRTLVSELISKVSMENGPNDENIAETKL